MRSHTMLKSVNLFVLFVGLAFLPVSIFAQSISRIATSPYPTSMTPDTLYLVNIDAMPSSQQLAVVTLQGLLAKVKPRIMVNRGARDYISDLQANYGVTYDSTYFTDFRGLIAHFKSSMGGYILCHAGDSTTNAAISICSPMNGIAVNVPDTAFLDSIGIHCLYNTTLAPYGGHWSFDTFASVYNKRILTIQDWGKPTFVSDYSVFAGAYHFYDFPADVQARYVLSHMQLNGAVFGWFPAEEYLVTETSAKGLHMHASDFSNNLSVYSNFNIPQQHQINHTDDTILRPGVHTVCFMMTDGDNIQWTGGDGFLRLPNWYGNTRRGEYNIGWTLSPALAELAPTQMKYIYDHAATTANGRDGFTAAASGMGYSYPDIFPVPDSGAAITARMLLKADMSILNVIAINYSAASLAPYLAQPNIDAILYYTYGNNYWGLNGYTDCINDKPVISARYNLVQPDFSTYSLAQALDTQARDPYSDAGYSLVAVNVWSSPLDSVIKCIQMLDSNIRVVTPESFVKLYKKGNNCVPRFPASVNTVDPNSGVVIASEPNPCSDHMDISYTLPKESSVKAELYDQCGKLIKSLLTDHSNMGMHQFSVDMRDVAPGIYYYRMEGDYFSATRKCLVIR